MQIEDVYIKFVKIRNHQAFDKQFYILTQLNGFKSIGKVIKMQPSSQKIFQLTQENIKFNSCENIFISLWEYDSFKEIANIHITKQQFFMNKYLKFMFLYFELQILYQSKSQKSQITLIQRNNQASFLQLHRNSNIFIKGKSFNIKNMSSYHISAPSFGSFQKSYKSFQNIEQEQQNQTSLQKLINDNKKNSQSKNHMKSSNKQLQMIGFIQNRNSIKINHSINLFDDYEAKPKQLKKQQQVKYKNNQLKQRKQNISKQANSTISSSVVKKNLKNTIKILTENPLKIEDSKKIITKFSINRNKSRQFFDYGLLEWKQIQNNSNVKFNKNQKQLRPDESLKKFYQKTLSRKQIQKIRKMSTFELSQSIYQQYGLDLSLNKTNKSKSAKNSKQITKQGNLKNKQFMKVSDSFQVNKYKRKGRQNPKIQKKININKFEDYGQQSLSKKQISSSKSLRKIQKLKKCK